MVVTSFFSIFLGWNRPPPHLIGITRIPAAKNLYGSCLQSHWQLLAISMAAACILNVSCLQSHGLNAASRHLQLPLSAPMQHIQTMSAAPIGMTAIPILCGCCTHRLILSLAAWLYCQALH
eukprot:3069764-Lingulodinium_polyedra.AAC.1